MKSFLVCVTVLGLASSSLGRHPNEEKYVNECAKEVGVEPDFIEKLKKDGINAIESHESKCLFRCVLTKLEIIKDDQPNMDQLKEALGGNDDAVEKVKLCTKDSKQEDPCDRIYEILKCFLAKIENSPK